MGSLNVSIPRLFALLVMIMTGCGAAEQSAATQKSCDTKVLMSCFPSATDPESPLRKLAVDILERITTNSAYKDTITIAELTGVCGHLVPMVECAAKQAVACAEQLLPDSGMDDMVRGLLQLFEVCIRPEQLLEVHSKWLLTAQCYEKISQARLAACNPKGIPWSQSLQAMMPQGKQMDLKDGRLAVIICCQIKETLACHAAELEEQCSGAAKAVNKGLSDLLMDVFGCHSKMARKSCAEVAASASPDKDRRPSHSEL